MLELDIENPEKCAEVIYGRPHRQNWQGNFYLLGAFRLGGFWTGALSKQTADLVNIFAGDVLAGDVLAGDQGVSGYYGKGTIQSIPENNDPCDVNEFLEYILQSVSSYSFCKNC